VNTGVIGRGRPVTVCTSVQQSAVAEIGDRLATIGLDMGRRGGTVVPLLGLWGREQLDPHDDPI